MRKSLFLPTRSLKSKFLPVGLSILALDASCATLQVNNDGLLSGAHGVLVLGTLYNVQFKDGTPRQVFNGADEATDFFFSDQKTALAAASALMAQVFIDDLIPGKKFDTDYNLTVGLNNPYGPPFFFGTVNTPYGISEEGGVDTTLFTNAAKEGDPFGPVSVDSVGLGGSSLDFNWQNDVWAVWSPIPEPEPEQYAAAFGAALLGTGVWLRRKKA